MARPRLEVADVFRAHGAAWRKANAGHVSLGQLKVMSAIETCRTAALGGHVERCEDCAHERVAYEAFGRRPRVEARAPAKGRRPKPFSEAVIRDSNARVFSFRE